MKSRTPGRITLAVDLDYEVRPIPSLVGKAFIKEHHYSHGCHNGPTCYGMFDGEELIGVLAIATPCSENVRASVFGPQYKDRVTELHRLVILDVTERNAESWFISRALKLHKKAKPHIWAVVSFADATEGHVGTIYQATNAIFYGSSSRSRFYRDPDGRLRHPRQNGVNVSLEAAQERGWSPEYRDAKYRYLFLLPDNKWHKKQLQRLLRVEPQPYPEKAAA